MDLLPKSSCDRVLAKHGGIDEDANHERSKQDGMVQTRICNGCKEIFKAEECTIDIGEFWNVRDDMVYACSDKCAEDVKRVIPYKSY